jgi:hypothetical protein
MDRSGAGGPQVPDVAHIVWFSLQAGCTRHISTPAAGVKRGDPLVVRQRAALRGLSGCPPGLRNIAEQYRPPPRWGITLISF